MANVTNTEWIWTQTGMSIHIRKGTPERLGLVWRNRGPVEMEMAEIALSCDKDMSSGDGDGGDCSIM